jgi:GTP-binding protein YchF
MKVGIIGYGSVGKTTLFSALTGQAIAVNVPGERHWGVVDVVDRRLDQLRDVFQPRKFTRARFDVEDLPAIPQGDVKGKDEVLASLREPEAVILLVGAFEQARAMFAESMADPAAQLQSLNDDLLLLDMEIVEKRLSRIEDRWQKKPSERAGLERERQFVGKLQKVLEEDEPFPEVTDKEEQRILAEMRLFCRKPKVAVFNVDEGFDLTGDEAGKLADASEFSAVLCATVEHEIAQMEAEERAGFLEEFGLKEPASERLTMLAYQALNLISFFTVGQDEVRAWPIVNGSNAVTAAGKVHTDLARGFIRAETTPYDQVAEAKDEREYKNAAKTELKGKDYIVRDGDILNIRSGV